MRVGVTYEQKTPGRQELWTRSRVVVLYSWYGAGGVEIAGHNFVHVEAEG